MAKRLLEAAAEAPIDKASAALDQLRIQAERMTQDAATPDGSQATHWLLEHGVVQLAAALLRPEFGEEASPEAAQQVAALCRALLAAAHNESQDPDRLPHVLRCLQFAAPACLRLLNLWFSDAAPAGVRSDERLALAVMTAELADAAAFEEELQGCEAQLLRFLDGCLQRLNPGGTPVQPAATCSSSSSSSPTAAAAAAAHVDATAATAWTAQAGWAAAVGHAALAVARLATSGGFSGGGGGSGSGKPHSSSSSSSSSSSTDAAFAASLAAAQALLDHYTQLSTDDVEEDKAVTEAIAAPLEYGRAYSEQQQLHLLRTGAALQAAVSDLAAADGRHRAAEAARSGEARGGGAAAGSTQPAGPSLSVLTYRVHLLASTLLPVIMPLFELPAEELAAWPAYRPWSAAIAAALEQLAPLNLLPPPAPPSRTVQSLVHHTYTLRRALYSATAQLLSTAEMVMAHARGLGEAALQRPPPPGLLTAAAAAAAIDPRAVGLERRGYAMVRTRAAESVADFIAATADALAASRQAAAPLLRDACCALGGLLCMAADGPGSSVWRCDQRRAEGAEPASSLDFMPGQLLRRLACLATRMLRDGAPDSALLLGRLGAEALVAALAPPPAAHGAQPQRRLQPGATDTIQEACTALAALCELSAEARRAVPAARGGGGWSAVAAAIGQAVRQEDVETRQRVKAALQQVDDALGRQREAVEDGGAEDVVRAVPPRRKGPHKQKAKGVLPDRTADSAEAAMRALLLEEEEAAPAAGGKAARRRPKGKQAAVPAGPPAKAACTAPAAASMAVSSIPTTAGTAEEAITTAAAEAAAAAPPPPPAAAAAAAGSSTGPALEADWQWMRCPITQEVMRDPVLCKADGQTYERAAITTWLHHHGTCFASGARAHTRNLIPNHALRSIIQAAGL